MLIKTIPVGQLETNCYVVTNEDTLECVVIDPGDESNTILDYMESNHLKCRAILLTHGHYDHTSGVAELRELLLRLRGEGGMTLLISSHLLEELHKIATDYIFLRYGTVLEAISAQELDRRVEAGGLKNVEEYYLRLNREAREREGSFLWGKEA